ncbi:branched-chain amino acid ABC transporter permease [Ahrensia sp. AH-315-G08]|nr:branched-chain amino acid ABC transporter permease [Ahrensia sp. AH-315-G08]
MTLNLRAILCFAVMAALLLIVGFSQSWNVALSIFNLCIISAVMALGVNVQWGYAGLFNVGIMGFAALGGAAALLTSRPPVTGAWAAGGLGILASGVLLAAVVATGIWANRKLSSGLFKTVTMIVIVLGGYLLIRQVYDPAVNAIEAFDAAKTGYLGGLGLPIVLSWVVGGVFAAGAAWFIGKVALGLRSDYLAIATLGISEILIAMLKNEDWLTRGVKNVTGLQRPVPYELNLQENPDFISWIEWLFSGTLAILADEPRTAKLRELVVESSSLFVKLCYSGLFLTVLAIVLSLCVYGLASPWGRMVRAIRDNEVSAAAMGKNITRRHLQLFILGSTVVGIAGAMLTTLDGQFTPSTYQPLRYTFLIWVMVIVGGSGNNLGAVLGAFLIWFIWIEAEPAGNWLMQVMTSWMSDDSDLRHHLINSAQYMRLIIMGMVMLLVMRFSPGGILPESTAPGRPAVVKK